jgi:SufS family cysteine desulfurase
MTSTTQRLGSSTATGNARADFPFFGPGGGGAGLAYLDNAASTQKPLPVLAAITDFYTVANSNIGRGYYRLAFTATDRYEAARAGVQRFLNAADPAEIVFTRGTTDAMNLLADTLGRQLVGPGDQVLVTAAEHNSGLLPWRRLCERVGAELLVAPTDDDGRVLLEAAGARLGPRVRVAVLTHVSNVLGGVSPIPELVAAAHRHGAVTVVDGAQAVAHRPVDVQALGTDFYCFSGHKVYGPMGSGALYGRRELLTQLPPYQVGGGTVKGVRYDQPVQYVPVPARLEAGTPDVAGAVGLAAALNWLQDLGWDAVRRHDRRLVSAAVAALADLPGVTVVGRPELDPAGIVSFVVDGVHPYDVGGHLDANSIAVRSGVHCASTFLDRLGLLGTVRMSFAAYNDEDEIAQVATALRTLRPGEWTRDHPRTRFL